MAKIKHVAVIGTGTMGPGIAAVVALAGHAVTLIGERADWAEDGVAQAHGVMEQLLANDLTDREAVSQAKCKLRGTADFDAGVQSVELVIEAVYENLELKQQIFQRLDQLTPPETLLATNTSGLSVTAIAALAQHRDRIVTTHFWMPPHLVPLVEVVMSPDTSEATAQALLEFLTRCGKKPVLVRKDLPGQLANRILQAMIREATSLVEQGVATAEDVDSAIKNGLGIRLPAWGILEHIDAAGLDLCLEVQKNVLPALNNIPRPVKSFEEKVARGDLGCKSGKGYYDWRVRNIDSLKKLRDDFIIQTLRFKKNNNRE